MIGLVWNRTQRVLVIPPIANLSGLIRIFRSRLQPIFRVRPGSFDTSQDKNEWPQGYRQPGADLFIHSLRG